MSTMNISLPEKLKDFVDEHVKAGHYGTSSEYLRELIRRDASRQHLRGLIMEGLESKDAGVANAKFWAAKRRRLERSK